MFFWEQKYKEQNSSLGSKVRGIKFQGIKVILETKVILEIKVILGTKVILEIKVILETKVLITEVPFNSVDIKCPGTKVLRLKVWGTKVIQPNPHGTVFIASIQARRAGGRTGGPNRRKRCAHLPLELRRCSLWLLLHNAWMVFMANLMQ